ncbi:hypothetical protein JJQ97_09015 [Pseudomonas syringae]|uniref:hypothetical protein n=1 Tax=Pseudomonas syringae TaxID=317 RepID=UPI001916E879|nr:hypothetical protein [Pseudomonas syringae]QQQ52333.1 hypothetical protein JJQ97_09015 [Pseudomonas syringae]
MSRVFFNIKVCGKESYREAFLDGQLYMNPLGFFRRHEEGATANIADRHEGTVSLLQPGQFVMTITSNLLPGGEYTVPAEDMAGPSVIQYDGHDTWNMLCLYAVHERGYILESDSDFERFVEPQLMKPEVGGLGDYAAVVVDPVTFQQLLFAAIHDNGFGVVAGLVDYSDPHTLHGSFAKVQAILKKRDDYSHQREYRFALDRGTQEESPFTLSLGSLRDIAIGCRTAEVNVLVKDYLYQLRDQDVFRRS